MQVRCVICNEEYETTEAFGAFYICPNCRTKNVVPFLVFFSEKEDKQDG